VTDADRILSEFIDAWHAGARPDAGRYVDRAPPEARRELAEAIETLMAMAREPSYDDAAWSALAADPAVARIAAAVETDAGAAWSALLPRLRARSGLSLDDLAGALAQRLGLAGREAKTREYLADLEQDRLVPERLSRRLLDALAAVLGAPVARLERAGAAPAPLAAALYRRQGEAALEQRLEVIADAMLADAAAWDEVDDVFQGGRDA
jgi:transcriptional regulator with XRE-family HTH domain